MRAPVVVVCEMKWGGGGEGRPFPRVERAEKHETARRPSRLSPNLHSSFSLPPYTNTVYELQGPALLDDKPKFFRKPWAMTTIMFAGMSFCLPLALAKQRVAAQKQRAAASAAATPATTTTTPLLGVEPAPPPPPPPSQARIVSLLAIPTAFDLVATVLMNVGLLSVTVSWDFFCFETTPCLQFHPFYRPLSLTTTPARSLTPPRPLSTK